MRTLVIFGMLVGSTVGSYVPMIWGGSLLSVSSILFGGIGGILGIWAGYKLAQMIGVE